MKKLFKSIEDYTKQVVQIEILQIDDKLYMREWTKIMVQGKARKAKRGMDEYRSVFRISE